MPLFKRYNSWYADFYHNGRRVKKRLSSNKATAQKIYEEMTRRKDLLTVGLFDYSYDLKKVQKQFLIELEPRIGAKTLHDYNVILGGVLDCLRKTPFDSIRNDFNEYILERQKQCLSSRTLNLTIELTKRMFRHAVETKLLPSNPIANIKKLKKTVKLKRSLTPDEIKSLLERSGKYKIVWLTFIGTGLRKTELVELRWRNVDLKKGMISIAKERPGKGIGTVPLSKEIKRELEQIKKEDPESFVFTTKEGNPLRNNLTREFKICLRKAGIDQAGISIHSLRYTFATILASRNVHPKIIQTLMRHKSITTSMDIYTNVYKPDLHNAIESLEFL